ncbi:MAG: CidA/LrgA family protein [Acetatifactor sp.]|nr:CidA/LrgA family protein [Acetatifactor sp.]
MKYLKQFLIILAVSFAGEVLHELLPLPIPASIYGIILLFFLLKTKLLPLSSIKETAKFLVEIMPVMFIPAAVGIMDSWGIIAPSWLVYLTMTVVSTVVVMAASGLATQAVLRLGKGGKRHG